MKVFTRLMHSSPWTWRSETNASISEVATVSSLSKCPHTVLCYPDASEFCLSMGMTLSHVTVYGWLGLMWLSMDMTWSHVTVYGHDLVSCDWLFLGRYNIHIYSPQTGSLQQIKVWFGEPMSFNWVAYRKMNGRLLMGTEMTQSQLYYQSPS